MTKVSRRSSALALLALAVLATAYAQGERATIKIYDRNQADITVRSPGGALEVLSYSFREGNPARVGADARNRRELGTTANSQFTFTMHPNVASARLREILQRNERLQRVVLEVGRESGGRHEVFEQVMLSDVLISAFNAKGAGAGGAPTEEVTLSYGKIEYSYSPQHAPGGSSGNAKASYNLSTSKVN